MDNWNEKPVDILAIGEPMIEFNQTGEGGGRLFLQGYGGDTSNAMVAAARLGARSAYFTRVGDDEFGRMLQALWREEGVDVGAVQEDATAPTGIYFVTHGPQGHAFSYRRAGSAASLMRPADLPRALVQGARMLHVSGISQAISASATDTIRHAIELARAAGVRVAYDPNLRLRLWPLERARAVMLDTLPLVDVFLPGLDELRTLSGLGEADADAILDWCHARGVARVVLKLGAEGSIVSEGGERTRIAPFQVDAVDATGAGDCFDGALLTRLCAGDDLRTAARYASAAAALATTGYGAVAPLPRPGQVEEMLGRG
jgi:2-dehydro-3-deoxygluconokinase